MARGEVLLDVEKKLNALLNKHIAEEGNIISILQDIEASLGYISEDAVNWVSKKLQIPASRFFGVVTFYAQFHLTPRGKNIITACCGTACHVKGSERLLNGVRRELGLSDDEDTTKDKEITVEKVNCVGACSIAPVFIINKKVHGKSSTDKLIKEIKTLRGVKDEDE
ncbi:MAG: NAD(P)H-dependent oxidoreductase subunit E [Nitrospirae bacterium]|nr:NAD(P)H-dependent oxidoreductase subunit E [Nitrospirota bacterium]